MSDHFDTRALKKEGSNPEIWQKPIKELIKLQMTGFMCFSQYEESSFSLLQERWQLTLSLSLAHTHMLGLQRENSTILHSPAETEKYAVRSITFHYGEK